MVLKGRAGTVRKEESAEEAHQIVRRIAAQLNSASSPPEAI